MGGALVATPLYEVPKYGTVFFEKVNDWVYFDLW